jgi:outer membrane lipoprotein carrier protein
MRTLTFLILSLAALPGIASGESLENVLKDLQASYESIRTIEAQFHQTYRSKRFEARTAEGVLYMQKPGKMRWDYSEPKGRVLVSDGRNLTLFDPADEQALVTPISEKEGLPVPLSFLWGKGRIDEVFTVTIRDEKEGVIRLKCLPRTPIPNVQEVELTLKSGHPTLIVSSRVIDALGGENELSFSDVRTNGPIEGRRFEFKLPEGARKVRIGRKEI